MKKSISLIQIEGTYEEIKEKLKMLKKKYGSNTPIMEFIDDPFLWTEN